MRSMVLLTACVLLLPACTFVHMAPAAKQVKVLLAAPDGCAKRGEVEVSVKYKVGFYERDTIQVRDELETLARNEAPALGANRISPLTAPQAGRQRWGLWHCAN